MNSEGLRVCIVHDYLTQRGGAERVVLAMLKAYPYADLYTSIYDPQSTFPEFRDYRIHTTFLQKFYIKSFGHRIYLPLYPLAFESLNLKGYEVIISSTTAFAKCVKKNGALHISYINTPPRFLWLKDLYFENENFSFAKRVYLGIFYHYLIKKDISAVNEIDLIISNSENIRRRVKEIYGRDSIVIHPPVDVSKFYIAEKIENYYLIVSRLVAHKKVDIAIRAFNRLGLPLKIVGSGPMEGDLRKVAGPNVEFMGSLNDNELKELYAKCRALVFPQEEDFGIVPVECMASGRPVIAYGKGGVLETVVDGKTGIFFHAQTPEAIESAVRRFEEMDFEPYSIREHARKFDVSSFVKKLREVVDGTIHRYGS